MNSKWDYVVLAGIAVFIILSAFCVNDFLSDAGDNAQYMILGKSLITGHGYREINDPLEPVHTKLPPMFPVMLAPLMGTVGYNIIAAKILVIACAVVAFIFLYLLLKEYVSPGTAALITFSVIFSFEIFHWTTEVMSEIPFLMFSIMALYFYKKEKLWQMCLFIALASLTRTTGLVLIPAIGLALVLRKEFRAAITMAFFSALPSLAWFFRNSVYPNADSYINYVLYIDPANKAYGMLPISAIVSRIMNNTWNYLQESAMFVSHYRDLFATYGWLAILVMGITVVGLVFYMLRNKDPLPYYVICFYGLMIAWPWETIRFIVPLAPFILLFFVLGLKEGIDLTISTEKRRPVILGVFLIALFLIQLPPFIDKYEQVKAPELEQPMQMMKLTAQWAKQNTNKTDVTMVRKPYNYFIWSERPTRGFTIVPDQQALFLELMNVDYVFMDTYDQQAETYIRPIINDYPELFVPQYTLYGGQLLKVASYAKQVYRNETNTITDNKSGVKQMENTSNDAKNDAVTNSTHSNQSLVCLEPTACTIG